MNPEFRRNLWLEITPHRLASMILILAGIDYLAYLGDGSRLGEAVAVTSLMIATALCTVWGSVQAADSVISEVQGGTWEMQRMSALTPWQLCWGKLFGGTVFSWFGTLLSLLVYLLSSEGRITVDPARVFLLVILAGLFAQGISLISVLYAMRKDRALPRVRSGVFAVVGLFFVLPLIQLAEQKGGVPLHWYGIGLQAVDFILASLLIFDLWIAIGIVRAMRSELQMHNTFWLWALFVIWMMAYMAGFPGQLARQPLVDVRIGVACATGLTLFYMSIFVDSKSPVLMSRLLAALKRGDWRNVQFLIPNWIVVLLLTALAVLLAFVLQMNDSAGYPGLFFLSLLMFALRDLFILLALNFGVRRNRADIAAVIYLGVLYGLLPSIVAALSSSHLLLLFYPRPGEVNGALSIIAPLAEAALAFWWMRRRWRENYAVARPQQEEG